MKTVAFTDGATWETNPGYAGIGVVFDQGTTLCEPIGWATSNEAEYTAVERAIEHWMGEIATDDFPILEVRSDSQLIVNQMNGSWKTRASHLRQYHNRVVKLVNLAKAAEGLVVFVWVPREQNKEADTLSKAAAELSNDEVH